MGSGSNYKPGDKPVPDYKVESFLGEGGYGCVYKVVNVKTGISKALKVITLRDTQGYKEYTALALFKEIRHPNLVPIEHYWLKDEQHREIKFNDDESLNIASRGVVELLILLGLGDLSLADRLKKCVSQTGTGIPVEDLMDYMGDIAKAIDFLNTPKRIGERDNVAIQHGDIKPGNVLIVGTGVQVGDYGLAQAISVTPETGRSKTTTGGMAGTPEYAAPEQVGGKASRSSDQYSLAISYYEMRTGKLPFDDQANRYACLAVDGLDFSLVPPSEQEILTKATDRQYAKRYNTCMEFVRALKRAHAHAGFGTMVNIPVYRDPEPAVAAPARVELLDKLKEGSEDFLPGFQVGKQIGRHNDEELWHIVAKADRQNYLLKVIRCVNTSKAFDEYNALSKLHNITFDKILNIEKLSVVDRMGKEIATEHLKQANVLFDKIILVLIESVEKTLEDHVLDMKKNPYNDRLKRKWYDVINHICKGADYWNKHCYRAYRELNPASILVNRFDQIKIDSAGVARYFRKDRPSSTNLADSFSFIAPEVFDSNYCDQSDQYSLAMIYYWLCMGDTIFPASFKPADIKNYLQDSYLDFTKDLPDEAEILTRATLLDPQMRFPDSIEFIQAFEVALKITSIESWNAQKLRDLAKNKVEQLVEVAAPAPVSSKLKDTPPRTTPPAPPSRGQSIRFPGEIDAGFSPPTEKDIPAPRSTPKDWKKNTEREPARKTPSNPVIEPSPEAPFSLDDEVKQSSPWPFRVLLGILLIGVFAGTLYFLNKWGTGHVASNTSPIPSQTQPVEEEVGKGKQKGTTPIKGNEGGNTVATAPAPNWDKDFRGFKESLKSASSLASLSKALQTSVPVLKQTHAGNTDASRLLSAALSFDTFLKTSDTLTTKPITQQTQWIKDYQAGKASVDPELAALYAPYTGPIETSLVKHAVKLVERAPDSKLVADQQTYLELVKPYANDAKTGKLLELAILECAITSGNKTAQVPEPGKDDIYGNYIAALAAMQAARPDHGKIVGLLASSIKPVEQNIVMQDALRRGIAGKALNDALTSARGSSKTLGDFNREKKPLARQSLELLVQVNGQQPGVEGKIKDRTHGELAMLLAGTEPKNALTHFAAIKLDQLNSGTFNDKEQAAFFTSFLTALAKEPGYDQQKGAGALKLLTLYATKHPEITLGQIQNLCLKILTENTNTDSIDKPTAQALSQSLFELSQSILKDPGEAKRTVQDDLAKVDGMMASLTALASKLNPDNSLSRIYGQLFESRLISFTSMFFSHEGKPLETTLAVLDEKYLESKQPKHYSNHLYKAVKALLPLKEAMENQQDATALKPLQETCKSELEKLSSQLDNDSITITEFERMSAHTLAAYMYNVLANNSDTTANARTCLDHSIKCVESAEKLNQQLGNPYFEIDIQNIRGLTFEDQAWVLRDPKTTSEAYHKALDAYGVVLEKTAPRSRQKAKATVDLSRCIFRYASTASKGSYETRLSGAENIISDFVNDAAFSDQFPREKIEALYFVSRLHRSQLVISFSSMADTNRTAERLSKIIGQLEAALHLSNTNSGYYQRNILIELALYLEDQTALIAEPQSRNNIYYLTSKNEPDATANNLLEIVKNNKIKLNKISEDYQARYPTLSDFCNGIDLLYESAKLLDEWSKSEKLDAAYDLFKKALADPNKELLKRSSRNLMKIARAQCENAFPVNAGAGNAQRQAVVGERWIYSADMLIETDRVVNKDPFLTSNNAAKMSRVFYGLFLGRYNHKFMLTTAVNSMVRAITLDTGEKSPFASADSEASSNLSILYRHLAKEAALNADQARLEAALKAKWGNKMPGHLSALFKTENK